MFVNKESTSRRFAPLGQQTSVVPGPEALPLPHFGGPASSGEESNKQSVALREQVQSTSCPSTQSILDQYEAERNPDPQNLLVEARFDVSDGRTTLSASAPHLLARGQPKETLPSLGAVWHASRRCLPCKYFKQVKGCKDGAFCEFCHADHDESSQGQVLKRFRRGYHDYKRRHDSLGVILQV
eukprot:TRINITY_DN30975_c0_g1_i1.p1 TRINITY_DN30975_c0_g1~~TRINITY_DN30975_c0_g1_i1.p1  ORF type:complete len:183 (+),score=14.08 TRINITY_DN30975_c0_g1_i1:124-672(+)